MTVSDKFLNTLTKDQVKAFKLLGTSDLTDFEKLAIVMAQDIKSQLSDIKTSINTLSATMTDNNLPIPEED